MPPVKTILAVAVFVLWRLLHGVTGQFPEGEYSVKNMMLRQNNIKKMKVSNSFQCLVACEHDVRCQSFNYVIAKDICELNNRTKEARPEDFVPDVTRYYFGGVKNKVPLGFIPELPAKSCKEIKASEGEKAVSGKYWFDSIKPGETILADCDMNTEDINECTAADQLCDFNANCINTHGSYNCSCFSGFTGDGKSCQDIDECVSGNHSCESGMATCINTIGSYKCSCDYGYDNVWKTCIAHECLNYKKETGDGRKHTYINNNVFCDDVLYGWYRFQNDAYTKMATSCVPTNRCNTHATGWLNGAHPTVEDGKVTRQVCFNYFSNCCQWSINIQVRNCGDFFIYHLSGTPPEHPCNLRYCTTD